MSELDPVAEPEKDDTPTPAKGEDIVAVDLHGADSLYWVLWPSLVYPGLQFMIGWPMRTHVPQKRSDN